jgi:hypothetical protein
VRGVGSRETIEVTPAGVKSRSVTKRHHGTPLAFSVISCQRMGPEEVYSYPVHGGNSRSCLLMLANNCSVEYETNSTPPTSASTTSGKPEVCESRLGISMPFQDTGGSVG